MAKKLASQKINKSAVVREAIAKGIEKPQLIVEHVKKTHGITLDVRYVSVVKSGMGRKPSGRRDIQKAAMLFVLKAGSPGKAINSVNSLRKNGAVDFILSAGGFDQALTALSLVSESIK